MSTIEKRILSTIETRTLCTIDTRTLSTNRNTDNIYNGDTDTVYNRETDTVKNSDKTLSTEIFSIFTNIYILPSTKNLICPGYDNKLHPAIMHLL